MPATLARKRPCLGDACQSSEMTTLLNSLFLVFIISFLPKYRVKCYDYIVKWYGMFTIGVYRWILPKFIYCFLTVTKVIVPYETTVAHQKL